MMMKERMGEEKRRELKGTEKETLRQWIPGDGGKDKGEEVKSEYKEGGNEGEGVGGGLREVVGEENRRRKRGKGRKGKREKKKQGKAMIKGMEI